MARLLPVSAIQSTRLFCHIEQKKLFLAFRVKYEMNDKQISTEVKVTSLKVNHKAPIKDPDDK
jgi:hypothetical protein